MKQKFFSSFLGTYRSHCLQEMTIVGPTPAFANSAVFAHSFLSAQRFCRSVVSMSSKPTASALVTAKWLESRLQSSTVLDASWYMPAEKRDPYVDFQQKRIPGARYFDIDGPGLCDKSSSLPHMLPAPEDFAAKVSELGVTKDKPVVVYAKSGFVGAARAWWMFRLHGKLDSYLLDGGLKEWEDQGLPVDTSPPSAQVTVNSEGAFVPRMDKELVRNMQDMLLQIEERKGVIIDARSKGRFYGTSPEPRLGLLSGHMPSAFNLPSSALVDSGKMKSPADLREEFQKAGVDIDAITGPVSLTCGSGVTAAILCLALHELGITSAVYDGSWSEYGAYKTNPVTTS